MSHKPDRGWTPKAYKEREIPIPAKLVKGLKAWKAKANRACNLVFPTAGCNPKLDFLDCPEGHGRPRKARRGEFLAAQIPRDVRDAVFVGGSRSPYRAAVAGSLRHGIDDAVLEAVSESGSAGEGERDLRLGVFHARRLLIGYR